MAKLSANHQAIYEVWVIERRGARLVIRTENCKAATDEYVLRARDGRLVSISRDGELLAI